MILLKPGDRVTVSGKAHRGNRLAGRQATISSVLSEDDFYDYLVNVDGEENWIGVGVLQEELIPLPARDVIVVTDQMRARGLTTEDAVLALWLAHETRLRTLETLKVRVRHAADHLRGI